MQLHTKYKGGMDWGKGMEQRRFHRLDNGKSVNYLSFTQPSLSTHLGVSSIRLELPRYINIKE